MFDVFWLSRVPLQPLMWINKKQSGELTKTHEQTYLSRSHVCVGLLALSQLENIDSELLNFLHKNFSFVCHSDTSQLGHFFFKILKLKNVQVKKIVLLLIQERKQRGAKRKTNPKLKTDYLKYLFLLFLQYLEIFKGQSGIKDECIIKKQFRLYFRLLLAISLFFTHWLSSIFVFKPHSLSLDNKVTLADTQKARILAESFSSFISRRAWKSCTQRYS